MSFRVANSILCSAKAVLKNTRSLEARITQSLNVFQGANTNRCFTRSLWHLSRPEVHQNAVLQSSTIPKMCGCCGLRTQGDQDMSQFLTDEIQMEKANSAHSGGMLPRVRGFEVSSTDGSEVVLPRLALQCQFPQGDDSDAPEQQEERYEDVIEITEVGMLPGKLGEDWSEKHYAVSGAILDGNLYNMMLTYLEERGVDGNFVNDLRQFSTEYEHKKYVDFLEKLKSFADTR